MSNAGARLRLGLCAAAVAVGGLADGHENAIRTTGQSASGCHAAGGNLTCRIDQIAEGDPVEWTLNRLRERLPEMLEHAGVPELAAQTRAEQSRVLEVIDQVADLLGKARVQAFADRGL